MLFSEWLQINEGKKDACYKKVKARYRVWPSAYACVPTETTKALTKEGWKNYEELQIGDQILTFSLQKNLLEFKPILNLHRYENAPTYVVQNGNTGFKFECTPNHKWVVKRSACKGKRRRRKLNHLINDMELVKIDDILHGSGSNRKLVISSNYLGGNPISMEKIYKYQTNWIEYLINCSPEQRESWLYSAIVYDGNQIKTERLVKQKNESAHEYNFDTPHGKQSFGFKQKDINHRDAFLLSAFMNQGIVTFRKHKNADVFNCHYFAYDGTKRLGNLILRAERNAEVWCPETENETWVMMQETDGNGIITITGNSGALSKCRKVGAKNWGNSSKKKKRKKKKVVREATETKLITFQNFMESKFKLEKERGLRGWFDRNNGKGWIDCKASKKGKLVACGRKKAGAGAERKYPACRPTLSACNSSKHKKKSSKPISWRKKESD
jgi:hypothetical protein